ncbi:MAG: hypothetical protein HYU86_07665 [Chloroflexi bacterium]|nr:hypothetical protein [Chloroflexota bacterium]
MRIRSTGLGRQELIGKFDKLSRAGDRHVVLSIRTTHPVRWHVRVAMDRDDIMEMMKLLFQGPTLSYMVDGLWRPKGPEETLNY